MLDPDSAPIDKPSAFARYRWRLAREFLSLTGAKQSTLNFSAVANNAAVPEKFGPNIIEDPSFENGPQTDGFPSLNFSISDRYGKPEVRPVGALLVTDETPHIGRFSLKCDFSKAAGKDGLYDRNRYLVVNVQVPPETVKKLRGQRAKVGCWFRLGGGSLLPGMSLRQSGKGEFLGGIEYTGGVADPAVWNLFETEGRLRSNIEGLDIQIHCRIPEADPELLQKSFFYLDDIFLQAVEEPPLALTTPLDEYYVGETIPWTCTTASNTNILKLKLMSGEKVVAQQETVNRKNGTFETKRLKPGIYTLHAALTPPNGQPLYTTQRQIILAPDPFTTTTSRRGITR